MLGLFVALATGTAYAANTVFSSDIVDGQVKAPDIDAGAVLTAEIANGQVKATDIGDGEVKAAEIAAAAVTNAELGPGAVKSGNVQDDNLTGADIAPNTLKGADVDEATLDIGDAARAYAWRDGRGLQRRRGLRDGAEEGSRAASIEHGTGSYCVIAPGIARRCRRLPVVAVDLSTTSGPAGNAIGDDVPKAAAPAAARSSGFEVTHRATSRARWSTRNRIPNDAARARGRERPPGRTTTSGITHPRSRLARSSRRDTQMSRGARGHPHRRRGRSTSSSASSSPARRRR